MITIRGEERNSEERVEEEGTTRPSPTASVLEAYHVVPPPSTSRNLLARTRILAKASKRIHTTNHVILAPISCSFSGFKTRRLENTLEYGIPLTRVCS